MRTYNDGTDLLFQDVMENITIQYMIRLELENYVKENRDEGVSNLSFDSDMMFSNDESDMEISR